MGFLQSDSQNIIVDTVLTDLGRQFLSLNNGSFSVVKFAVGDDEVDYTLIQKFGRTLGKEKIEKNTPIFEALTNQQFSQKYRCIAVSNPNLIRLPNLELRGEGVDSTNTIVSIGNTTVKKRNIIVSQEIQNESTIDVELRDSSFIIELSSLFLEIVGNVPDNIDGSQRASYIIQRDSTETSLGGSRISFTISTKAITESQFQIYGARNNKSLISTFVKVSGVNSGAVKEFEIQITRTS